MEALNAAEAGSHRGGPSFPLSNRIRRTIWALAWLVLARWTPPPLHGWRILVLKPVTSGANCWIAAEAFVGPGVTMVDGAVLGARGALFEGAAAYTVYRGNPAAAPASRRFEPDADASI